MDPNWLGLGVSNNSTAQLCTVDKNVLCWSSYSDVLLLQAMNTD